MAILQEFLGECRQLMDGKYFGANKDRTFNLDMNKVRKIFAMRRKLN